MSIILTDNEIEKFIKEVTLLKVKHLKILDLHSSKEFWSIDIFKNLLRFRISKTLPEIVKLDLIAIWLKTLSVDRESYIREV